MRREDGGIVLRLLLWAIVLVIVASAGLFIFVRTQDPLATGDAVVRGEKTGADPTSIRLAPGAKIYVATFIRNEGRMPVTLRGLADTTGDSTSALFIPTALALGDGVTPSPSAAAAFEPITIDQGEGVGVLITYAVNPDLDCSLFGADPGRPWPLHEVAIDASAYAMPFTQVVSASPAFVRVQGPTREICRAAVGRPAA